MIYLVSPAGEFGKNETVFNWHVGESLPYPRGVTITEVQADGDELEYIFNNFRGLPLSNKKRVQTWRGDFAQFIADNL